MPSGRRRLFVSIVSIVSLLLGSLSAAGARGDEDDKPQAAAAPPAATGASAPVKRGPFRLELEAEAVLVPADGVVFALWPRAHSGQPRILEVAAHAARVRKGDVVLRLDDEPVREALRAAEWDVRSAEVALRREQGAFEELEKVNAEQLARTERSLDLSRRSLKGYLQIGRALDERSFALSVQSSRHRIEDQEDEIEQLGKMYKEDELTEETEEIVLKRARRDLEHAKARLQFIRDEHQHSEEVAEPRRLEALEIAVETQERAHRDLRRSLEGGREFARIALERAEKQVADARRTVEELRRDLGELTIEAPWDGIVLHGDFLGESGAASPKPDLLRRGGTVAPYVPFLTLARPGPLKARFSVKAADRHRLTAGMAAALRPAVLPELSIAASLEEPPEFPGPEGAWIAHALFGHQDPRLLPLLTATVKMVTVDVADALTVPSSSLFQKGDRWIAYVRSDSPFGVVARTVVPGASDGETTVIREGLREGEHVLIESPER
jgi:hypothetical protein